MAQPIKIRQFGGLKTFIDPADMENGYFNTFKNIRSYAGYAESAKLNATDSNIIVPIGQTLILFDFVYLDEDKYKNLLKDNKLVYDYTQNIQKYELMITYGNNQNSTGYSIFIDNVFIGMHHTADEGTQYPYIINEKGIVKILFKEIAYLLAKYNRYYWGYEGADPAHLPSFIGEEEIAEAFIMYPLVKELSNAKEDAMFIFSINFL